MIPGCISALVLASSVIAGLAGSPLATVTIGHYVGGSTDNDYGWSNTMMGSATPTPFKFGNGATISSLYYNAVSNNSWIGYDYTTDYASLWTYVMVDGVRYDRSQFLDQTTPGFLSIFVMPGDFLKGKRSGTFTAQFFK